MSKTANIINHLHESEARWFAVYTRSRSEKFVQRLLEKKHIHSWVPLQKLMRRYTRSTKLVEKPLINCYVFVRIVKEQYVPVLETENVVGFVKFNKDLIAIPDQELEILRRITFETDMEVDVLPGALQTGDQVEIRMGNLMGMKGLIVKIEGKRKMQVELEHLGYSLLITIDAAFLEKTGIVL